MVVVSGCERSEWWGWEWEWEKRGGGMGIGKRGGGRL